MVVVTLIRAADSLRAELRHFAGVTGRASGCVAGDAHLVLVSAPQSHTVTTLT